jgi:Ca-activated chloride channel family protein
VKYLFFILNLFLVGLTFSQKTTRILFILDASNSMNLNWDKQTRMDAAKDILIQSVEKLRGIPNLEIALRVYGHQSQVTNTYQDCADTKLEVPFSFNTIDAIQTKVRSIIAKGATPIARSLEAAAGDFPDTLARNFIILITDGLESCDNDPCVIAKKLKEKGVRVTPFVIGLGMDLSYLEKFKCIGSYSDAESKDAFKVVLNNVISKALLNTTAQINLNDVSKKPTETNVTVFLYEAGTQNLKYTLTHTLNRYGNPDTLILDPNLKYDIVVNTLPKVEKKNVSLQKFTHNVIQIDAPQGFIKLTSSKNINNPNYNMRVMVKDQSQTLNSQPFNSTQKYLTGTYDLEIFTLPRTYQRIEVTQSKTTLVDVVPSGTFDYTCTKAVVGQIFLEKGNNVLEWVCNLEDGLKTGKWNLQPGNYKLIYREKEQKSTAYTKEKSFKIESNKILNINL